MYEPRTFCTVGTVPQSEESGGYWRTGQSSPKNISFHQEDSFINSIRLAWYSDLLNPVSGRIGNMTALYPAGQKRPDNRPRTYSADQKMCKRNVITCIFSTFYVNKKASPAGYQGISDSQSNRYRYWYLSGPEPDQILFTFNEFF